MNDSPLLLDIWKQVSRLTDSVAALQKALEDIAHWGKRFCILVSLWTAGTLGNLSNDQISQVVVMLLKSLIGG